jgi:hypothetical protein
VIYEGEIMGEMAEPDREMLGLMMTGSRLEDISKGAGAGGSNE